MNDRNYIVSRRDGIVANLTHFLRAPLALCQWTQCRDLALRLTFEDATDFVRLWNDTPRVETSGIQARVEDAGVPPPVYAEAA
jgi:hypothetical protein